MPLGTGCPDEPMAYDQELAERVRECVAGTGTFDEKSMFGGLAFLIDGHMAVAVSGQGGLMVRVSPQDAEELLTRPHVAPMVMSGRRTKGWLRVAEQAVDSDADLAGWVARGVATVRSLPPK